MAKIEKEWLFRTHHVQTFHIETRWILDAIRKIQRKVSTAKCERKFEFFSYFSATWIRWQSRNSHLVGSNFNVSYYFSKNPWVWLLSFLSLCALTLQTVRPLCSASYLSWWNDKINLRHVHCKFLGNLWQRFYFSLYLMKFLAHEYI